MESSIDLDKRVSILEVEMNRLSGTEQDIKKDLEFLKNSQFQLLDRISTLQTETIERISSLQAHTDDKFIAVFSQFADVHKEFSSVHKEISGIHHAISIQTKWLLAVIISTAAVVSTLHPLMQKFLL